MKLPKLKEDTFANIIKLKKATSSYLRVTKGFDALSSHLFGRNH